MLGVWHNFLFDHCDSRHQFFLWKEHCNIRWRENDESMDSLPFSASDSPLPVVAGFQFIVDNNRLRRCRSISSVVANDQIRFYGAVSKESPLNSIWQKVDIDWTLCWTDRKCPVLTNNYVDGYNDRYSIRLVFIKIIYYMYIRGINAAGFIYFCKSPRWKFLKLNNHTNRPPR